MRKLGSFLVILLLITAYGRCVADQLGMFPSTATSCCQVTCSEPAHCNPGPSNHQDRQPDHEHSHGQAPCESDHEEHGHEEHQPTPEDPPCQLCFILDSDSMIQGETLRVPTPPILELRPLFYFSTMDGPFHPDHPTNTLESPPGDHSDPPAELRSQMQRMAAKTTPVRGPSIV